MSTTQNSAVVPAKVISDLASGKIAKWGELVAAVAPPADVAPAAKVATPRVIGLESLKALDRLPKVYGKVVPVERRELEPSEVSQLLTERDSLKTIEKMLKERLDDISLIVKNHSTAEFEADPDSVDPSTVTTDPAGDPIFTPDGHIVRSVRVAGDDPALDKEFSIEVRKGAVKCDPNKLKDLAADEDTEFISHEDYLAMTTQVRVFDEAKAILAIRKNPDLLRAVREATVQGGPTVSVYERRRA